MGNKITPIREIKQVPKRRSILPAAGVSMAIIVIVSVILVIVVSQFINNKPAVRPKITPTPVKTAQTANTPTPTLAAGDNGDTASVSATPTPEEFVPEAQVIYYGRAGDKMGYFVTNKEMQKYTNRGSSALNAYKGQVLFEDKSYDMNYDFRQMENPKVVMKTDDILINGVLPAIGDFKRNDSTGMLYFILHTVGKKPTDQINIADVLYRVDLYYGRVRRIMSHQLIGGGVAQKGPVTIDKIWHDDFAILRIDNCISCNIKEPYNWVIVNVNTYEFRYLGTVGDIKEDPITGNFLYRKFVAVKESCAANETGCDALGEKIVYMPSGQIQTTRLP